MRRRGLPRSPPPLPAPPDAATAHRSVDVSEDDADPRAHLVVPLREREVAQHALVGVERLGVLLVLLELARDGERGYPYSAPVGRYEIVAQAYGYGPVAVEFDLTRGSAPQRVVMIGMPNAMASASTSPTWSSST